MEAVCTGAGANIISEVCKCVIGPLVQLIKDVIHLDRNARLLQEKLTTARAFVDEKASQFQRQQRDMPVDVNEGLENLRESLEYAQGMINRSQQRQGCLDRNFFKPRVCRQIRKCSIDIEERRIHLRDVISTQGIVSLAPLQARALLQTVPASGYLGSGIKLAEEKLKTWLEDAQDHQFRVIGVSGMGGIGKTSLLKKVYNSHKEGNAFEEVIWLTVSQKFNILVLQSTIAKAINLDLEISSSNAESSSAVLDMPKMRLYNYLKEKKFLLVLDDVWKPIQLEEELGIPLGNDKGSKVVISTRRIDVIHGMKADDYSIAIQPLSPDEGWQLFCREAFNAGSNPTENIEYVARQIAVECKGLPLAINVVAAAMRGNTTAGEWHLALTQMKTVDPNFLTYGDIDEDLYRRLQWSYDRLNDCNLQNCFLYCGAFSEDAEIEVERLVEMWIGEGMVNSRDKSLFMDEGRRYVKQLVERCLFEYVHDDDEEEMQSIKVHDIVRDMALYIAEKEGKCLFRTSQKLDEFPVEQVIDNCKRIAIRYYNDTAFLPTDLRCPELRTLILAQNEGLREVPNGFLLNLTSLRVLDLSYTSITSLPDSMWQLKQLQFVGLNHTKISSLPAEICNLSRLQFLHLGKCEELESLPSTIEKLKNLKHLDLNNCNRLAGIPGEICQLTSLNKLDLYSYPEAKLGVDEAKSGMCSLKDFTNFPNLMEFSVRVKPGKKVDGIRSGIKLGIMGTWLELKHLVLEFDMHSMDDDDVMEDLPPDMQNMKNLHSFDLECYQGISLPNCICDFERLEVLYLFGCNKLQELPPLERLPVLRVLTIEWFDEMRELGIRGSVGGFPMLERLIIHMMISLESISNVVWTEATLPKLQSVCIEGCRSLKRLPIGIEKLSNLKDIEIDKDVWERSIAADKNIKICLEKRGVRIF